MDNTQYGSSDHMMKKANVESQSKSPVPLQRMRRERNEKAQRISRAVALLWKAGKVDDVTQHLLKPIDHRLNPHATNRE